MTSLLIKPLKHKTPFSMTDVGCQLEAHASEIQIACLNWSKYPYCPKVSFRIGHIQTEIWLKFYVAENSVRALETRTHGEVYKDSCVEFFVSFDRINYYNFEFSCIGTTHLAYGPSRKNRKFLPLPLLDHLVLESSLGHQPFAEKAGGFVWTLTARIPLACFAFDSITSLSGVKATANFYKIGDNLAVPHYLTWTPVETEVPDYHRPEFFGDVRFE